MGSKRINDDSAGRILGPIQRLLHRIKCLLEDAPGKTCDTPIYVKACDSVVGIDFEYKTIGDPICYQCPDGTKYQTVLCIKYENGVEVGQQVIMLGPDGNIIETLPDCAEPCVTVKVCRPKVGNWSGAELPDDSFTDLQVMKKECALKCEILIITSAGEFTMYPGEGKISIPTFDCGVTIEEVKITEGDCKLSDIIGRWSHSGCNNC